ncbi:hypothetical protein GALMADRAFT_232975 [Galerina marginata CBS 339.88]|uniref:DUF6533 domain-containing protein n=1 Tax=Galerina marginata (strain CBS 339.88) TaxID=685588 RepID=A0A067S346_GALM3|nr:hypothetical protein GALMADRAFT_232975 [Galerina marginata CBS 339.88]
MSEIGPGVLSPHMLDAFRDIQAAHCARMASNSLILYDYLITFDKEVELVWNNRRSITNVVSFMNRYYILSSSASNILAFLVHGLTASVRRKYLEWEACTGLLAVILAQAILQLRIYALYTRSKKILTLMLACYFIQFALSGWMINWSNLSQLRTSIISFAGGETCVSSNENPQLYDFYIPPMIFDGLLCLLALIKGLQEFKYPGSSFRHGQSLIKILVRDSVLYFAIITITYLVCTLYLRFEPPALIDASIGFAPAMSSILASRVLFNLREAGLKTAEVYSTPQEVQFR